MKVRRVNTSKKQKLPKQVDAPNYRYWQALYMAFYSSRLYVDVVKYWRGFGLLYLLLLISVASIPLSIRVIIDFNQYFDDKLISPIQSLPPLKIHNGEVFFDKPMPYVLKDKQGKVVALIDTELDFKELEHRYPDVQVAVNRDSIYFKTPQFTSFLKPDAPLGQEDIVIQKLSEDISDVFVPKKWVKSSGVLQLKWITDALIYPMITAFFFGLYLTFFLVLTMMSQTVAWLFFKCRLNFKEAARLLMVSSSAQVMLLLFLLSADHLFTGLGIVCVALGAIYFCYGVISYKRESKRLARA